MNSYIFTKKVINEKQMVNLMSGKRNEKRKERERSDPAGNEGID